MYCNFIMSASCVKEFNWEKKKKLRFCASRVLAMHFPPVLCEEALQLKILLNAFFEEKNLDG